MREIQRMHREEEDKEDHCGSQPDSKNDPLSLLTLRGEECHKERNPQSEAWIHIYEIKCIDDSMNHT